MKIPQPRLRKLATMAARQRAPMLTESKPLTVLGLTCTVVIAALSGCASSQVAVVGRVRPAISPEQVQIYLEPPTSKYDKIANLSASSRWSYSITPQFQPHKSIDPLNQAPANL